MYRLGTRCAFAQLNPEMFRKITTFGIKDSNDFFSTDKCSAYTETSRSSCAPISSKVPTTSSRTDDVTKLGPVSSALVEDSPPIANQHAHKESLHSDDVAGFRANFPEILHDLTRDNEFPCHPEVMARFTKVIESHVFPGAKKYFLLHLAAYKAFVSPEQLTKENLRKAHILGWCCELALASRLITDDIMDDCKMRFGKPCWFRNKDVGMTAINDAIMMEYAVFELIRQHFRAHPLYTTFIEKCHKVLSKKSIDQCLNFQSIRDGKPQLDLFTTTRYDIGTKYKTGFAFHTPVAFALLLAGIEENETHSQVERIMMEIVKWYQAQDDYLDYAGTMERTGKDVGRDIKTGKCTWLAVTALERASPKQRTIMERCYGSSDPKDVQAVRELYTELNMAQLFLVYEQNFCDRIHTEIDQHFSGRPQEFFNMLIQKNNRQNFS